MNNADVFRSRTMRVIRIFIMFVGLFWFDVLASRADTHYVAQGGQTPSGDYTSWATAASNIQDAISVAIAGDTVLVSNGVYQAGGITNYPAGTILTNRVAITNAITVRSANNDPTNTVIKGAWDPATNGPTAVRCVYMVDNSSLIGFTLTNGATLTTNESAVAGDRFGGGVWCPSTNAMISNCVIAGNSAREAGGGAYYGTLNSCTIVSNLAIDGGGGAAYSTLNNCLLTGNLIPGSSGSGAGAVNATLNSCTLIGNRLAYNGGGAYNCTLNSCTLTSNSATYCGGGVRIGTLNNCTLTGNSSPYGGGAAYATLNNCLLTGNFTSGYDGGAQACTMYNCTIVGNLAAYGGGTGSGNILHNCIVYFNTATTSGSNWLDAVSFTNSCTTPAQDGWATGNITNDPMFLVNGSGYGTNHVAGNYRLAVGSPCRNTGTNFSWMTDPADPRSKDLDGNSRIDKYSGQVDMGCYEYLPPPPGTVFNIR